MSDVKDPVEVRMVRIYVESEYMQASDAFFEEPSETNKERLDQAIKMLRAWHAGFVNDKHMQDTCFTMFADIRISQWRAVLLARYVDSFGND